MGHMSKRAFLPRQKHSTFKALDHHVNFVYVKKELSSAFSVLTTAVS